MKAESYEQKMLHVAQALMNDSGGFWSEHSPEEVRATWMHRAQVALSAAGIEREKPVWPTDASVNAWQMAHRSVKNDWSELSDAEVRDCLREAIRKDIVFVEALNVANSCTPGGAPVGGSVKRLYEAAKAAGLLKEGR